MKFEQIEAILNQHIDFAIKNGLISDCSDNIMIYRNFDWKHTHTPMQGPCADAAYWIARKVSRGLSGDKLEMYSLHIDRQFILEVIIDKNRIKVNPPGQYEK